MTQYPLQNNIISHSSSLSLQDLKTTLHEIKTRIMKEGDKPDSTVAEQLELLDKLAEFELGRFLLCNRGFNGFWTRYMVLYPKNRNVNAAKQAAITELEKWILEKAPTVLATQERYTHFQRLAQENLRNNITLASLPCGMMDDLCTLDFSNFTNIKLVGIDLDETSLVGAKETAKKYKLEEQATFIKANAWQLNIQNEFDIITSNGLNIYEPNNDKLITLYQNFYTALKPKGLLITSFLIPPPALSSESVWNMEKINPEDLRLQKVIFSYIIGAKWQTFKTENEMLTQLKSVGFKNPRILYDQFKMFPTVIAEK